MQADTILRTKENGEEIWYSGEYVRKQIELAFQSGMAVGAKIEIHMMQPMSEQAIPDYTNEFWRRLNIDYKNEFDKGHVWKVAGERSINSR